MIARNDSYAVFIFVCFNLLQDCSPTKSITPRRRTLGAPFGAVPTPLAEFLSSSLYSLDMRLTQLLVGSLPAESVALSVTITKSALSCLTSSIIVLFVFLMKNSLHKLTCPLIMTDMDRAPGFPYRLYIFNFSSLPNLWGSIHGR